MLSAFFGGLALLLAAVGLYGVVAHAVRTRQAEIGLRMALGATPSSIVRLVFQRVGVLIAAGLALGLAGSFWAARFVEALLFHLEARDPVTFAGAAAVLVAVGRSGRMDASPSRRTARSGDGPARRVGRLLQRVRCRAISTTKSGATRRSGMLRVNNADVAGITHQRASADAVSSRPGP